MDIREKFLRNPAGMYVGEVANTDNELFRAEVRETSTGVVYAFQPIREDKVEIGPSISIPEIALNQAIPLFAQKIVEGDVARKIAVQEMAKKALTQSLAGSAVARVVGHELNERLMDQAIQENEQDQSEKETRKKDFFRKKANKEYRINKKISEVFDGKMTFTEELPTGKLPDLQKMNPEAILRQEKKGSGRATQSPGEALKTKETSGFQDARKRYDEQQREQAKNTQQQEAQKAEQRKQQLAQQRQRSGKSSSTSWLTGGAIGAGVTIGGTGLFTLLFS